MLGSNIALHTPAQVLGWWAYLGRCPLGRTIGALLGGCDPETRLLVVLTCYLDDSGTHDDCPVITMAGYVGFTPQWLLFEEAAKAIYGDYGIEVFHAKEFHSTRDQFKNWRRLKKQTYCKQIYDAGRDCRALDIGITFSVRKDAYEQRKRETGLNARTSAYGFCFTAILNHLLRDAVFKEILGRAGVDITFVVECGNANDEDLRRIFSEVRAKYGLERKLNSIALQPKDSSRALQLADFFAFYSRRHVEATERSGGELPEENFFLEQMQDHIYVIGEVATDFHAT